MSKTRNSMPPTVTLLHKLKGIDAVEFAEHFLFPYSPEEAKKWSSQWSLPQKKKAVLEIFNYVPRTRRYIEIKLQIGDSAVGERLLYTDAIKRVPSL